MLIIDAKETMTWLSKHELLDAKGKLYFSGFLEPLIGKKSEYCSIPELWGNYGPVIVGSGLIVAGGGLIAVDIILGGPTGEGIVPGTFLINRGSMMFR